MGFNQHLFRVCLQSVLAQHHLSLRDASQRSGVSASTLSRILDGKMPDMETFARIADWLHMDIGTLFDHQKDTFEDEATAWSMFFLSLEALDLPSTHIKSIENLVQTMRSNQ